jgi:hypothetical protein
MSSPSELLVELKRIQTFYANAPKPSDRNAELDQIASHLDALNGVTEAAISGLLEQRSRILESDRSLANLSSQCSNLCSSLARLQEGFSSYLRAEKKLEPCPKVLP